tara:strand:- start:4803 stop:4922 length:120 start_codon:yes stop_codon:yes gene_type:complete
VALKGVSAATEVGVLMEMSACTNATDKEKATKTGIEGGI